MSDTIEFFNRYTGRIEREKVYGDGFLKWTYQTVLGRLSLKALVRRKAFSDWYGWRMDKRGSVSRIRPFIRKFGVDESEFLHPVDWFSSFNDFFYRELKPEARPIFKDETVAVFPADGRHLGFQDVSRMDGIFVKGDQFSLEELLGGAEVAKRYKEGSMILSRLCPVDYHRYHFPVDGRFTSLKLLNGPLYSVNPIALKQNIRILAQNKRMLSFIESTQFGRVAMLEVGATCVGSMVYTVDNGVKVEKGDEKGYFRFGGSSTILLFEKATITLCEDLVENSEQHRELYAKMGDVMGTAVV